MPSDLVLLEPTGPLLSVLARGWNVGWGQLDPGEVLLLVTDGLLEARTAAGEEFGISGLCDAVSDMEVREVDAVVTALTSAARAYAEDFRRDDVTVLAVMRDPATAPQPAAAEDGADRTLRLGHQPTVAPDDMVSRQRPS